MRRTRWGFAVLAALLLVRPVRAGAPFDADDPGCVPDGKAAEKCGDSAGKALAKLVSSVLACHVKQAAAAFKQEAATFDEEACEQTDPTKSARAKFEAALAKLSTPCTGTSIVAEVDAVASMLLADAPAAGSLDTLNGGVYCDSTSGVPLDAGNEDAGFVPVSKANLACDAAVAKGLAKLTAAIATCHRKAAASGVKGGPTDDESCETAARGKFDAATAKLVAKEGCPACLSASAQGALADQVTALAEQAGGTAYPCPATTTTTTSSTTTTTTTLAPCTPATTHRPFTVSFSVPDSSVIVQGMTVLVDYPEGQVTIPGTGTDTSVKQSIINVQSGAISQPNDLDYALRDNLAGTSHALNPGNLFTINFLDCQGATPPTAADFTCTVEVATDPFGLSDQGVTCSVTAG